MNSDLEGRLRNWLVSEAPGSVPGHLVRRVATITDRTSVPSSGLGANHRRSNLAGSRGTLWAIGLLLAGAPRAGRESDADAQSRH
jgi:hypothetical protein